MMVKAKPHGESSICLLGSSLDNGNLGVQALASSLVQLISNHRPNCKIYFLVSGFRNVTLKRVNFKDHTKKVIELNFVLSPFKGLKNNIIILLFFAIFYRLVPSKSFRKAIISHFPILKILGRVDLVGHIWGGDSFSDIYGEKNFLFATLPVFMLFMLRKEVIFLPQTYGPFKSLIPKFVARLLLKKARLILARDNGSVSAASKLAPTKRESVYFCPDVAFTLERGKIEKIDVIPPLRERRFLVGLNVSGLLYYGGYDPVNVFGLGFIYREFIESFVSRLMKQTDFDLLLIPHLTNSDEWHVENDVYACREIFEKFLEASAERLHLVRGRFNERDIKALIGKCDFFIGSRMHACIAALSQGVPAIGVAYSKKFKGVFDAVGAGDCVLDARFTDSDTIINTIIEKAQNSGGNREDLKAGVEIARNEITRIFGRILAEF